jgi:membrane protease subunit (stomatin/prohibitin family)
MKHDFWEMPCAMGADLSQGDDFCAFTFLFPLRDGTFGVKCRSYITELTLMQLQEAMRLKYEQFIEEGTLIVMPGEEAIFIKGGNIEEVFGNGTYKLSTENYPFISRLRNAFTGGISTFNCVVYFVRKADSQEIRWGTETPIQVRDKVWGIRTDARVRGAYKVRIENPAKLLEKLIGNNVPYQFQEELNPRYR